MEELNLYWIEPDPDFGITQEGILCQDMNEVIEHITEVKDTVKRINLDNQTSLTEIPAILAECSLLEELNISHTKIKEIPDFLFNLSNLRSFSCCCNELNSFPQGISKAEKLEKLHIRINKGWTFPISITSLKNLKSLTVDFYCSVTLPDKLGKLSQLENLILAIKYTEGDVPALPNTFENHPALKKLIMTDPFHETGKCLELKNLAQILSSCHQLESLKLSGFVIGNEHESLSLLGKLKELELRHLQAEGNIFNSISSLQNLEILDIWGSGFKIIEIPDIFMNFPELLEFSFAGNIIKDLPQSIYTLSKLVTLEIGSTLISSLGENIVNLKNLKNLHVFDNMLQQLPAAIFTLPCLKVLNIEENMFSPNVIAIINEKLIALENNGQKIQFTYERQGNRMMVKKLRSLTNIDTKKIGEYVELCISAINENTNAIRYINKNLLSEAKCYAKVCLAAIDKTVLALENIDPSLLSRPDYNTICLAAVKNPNIGNAFKFIIENYLNDDDYIQICLEAANNNKNSNFLSYINHQRMIRKDYERICKIAVSRHPQTISRMIDPTPEIHQIAADGKYTP